MPTFDLFGQMLPDEFSRSIPDARPMLADRSKRQNAPHAMPRSCEIEIQDNARVLCRATKDGYLEGARIARRGGTPSGATSPGRDALLGWGDKAPVNGLMQAQIAYDNAPKRKRDMIEGA